MTVEVPPAAEELSSGEVPDWLMSMAPPGALEQPSAEPASMEITSEDINWLETLGAPAEGTASALPTGDDSSMMDEILGVGAAVGAAMALGNKEEQPAEEFPAQPAEETPDWLSELGGQSADATAVNLPPVGQPTAPVTDWLTDLESQATDATVVNLPPVSQPAEELPDELRKKLAEQYIRRLDFTNAALQLQGLIKENPTDPQPYFVLGNLALEQKKAPPEGK